MMASSSVAPSAVACGVAAARRSASSSATRYASGAHGVDELGGRAVAGGEEAVFGECLLGVGSFGWA